MQLAVEIYIYIYPARHRRQSTSEKIHKKGTGERTGDKVQATRFEEVLARDKRRYFFRNNFL
jgi:hypothetical protein